MNYGLTTFLGWISAKSYKLVPKVVSATTFNINNTTPWYTSWVWLNGTANGTATLVNPISNGVVLEIKNCSNYTLTINAGAAIIYVGGGIGIVSSVTLDPGGTIYMIPDGTYLQVIDWFQPA